MIEGMMIGINTAFSGYNIFMVMMGCFAGTIIGMLPGLGPMSAIALMIPVTYGFDPASAMILMAGVYYGAIFGGSTSSILINAPGVAGTVSSSFDGYPMAKSGQAGKALAIAAYASFSGGTIAAIFLLVAAPQLAKVSLSFQSADYFALMCVGLLSIAAFASKGQFLKAMVMTALGLALATVGQDSLSDITRFSFGNINLMDGISFVLLVMATFAMSEALTIIIKGNDPTKAVICGDGSFMKPHVLKEMAQSMKQDSVGICWQKGDVLCIDNHLVLHARHSFAGPRRILATISP